MSAKFYDLRPILKKDKPINVICGVRSNGKTYALKNYVLDKFFKDGKQFVWIRGTEDETTNASDTWLFDMDPYLLKLPQDIIVRTNSKHVYIKNGKDKEIIGHFITLSTQYKYKSASFPKVDTIIYDEMLKSRWYRKAEVNDLRELINTVQRFRSGVKLFLLSNSLSFNNPYFESMGIKKFSKGITILDGTKAIEYCDELSIELAKESKKGIAFLFGKRDDEYNNYATKGTFLMDNNTFVMKYEGIKMFKYNLEVGNDIVGLWLTKNKKLYFSKSINPTGKTYTLFKQDLGENIVITKEHNLGQSWLSSLYTNNIIFETLKIKQHILMYIKQHIY